tara:strand:- start:3087 stop:3641 length:555 start_codon:yes stop_codon:yes gene_type:complete
MKKSELASFIKEEIKSTLKEATIETSPEDLAKVKKSADKDDVIKVTKEDVANSSADVIDPAEYGDIGKGYLSGFNKPHSLNDDDLETLGRKVVKQLYKGDFVKAKSKFTKEDLREDEDKEPTKADLKKTKGLAKAKEELAQLTKQMKSLARKYKEAEGEEKEKIVADLKGKTKLKKELDAIIDK